MNVFSKYVEAGYSVMPVNAQTGEAIIKEWQKWSDELPPIELAQQWDEQYPINGKWGIALIFGPASRLECLDIDTTDPAIHAICPKSTWGKIGTPGRAAYFFQWNPKHRNISEKKTGVGLYHHGKYHIIPPSIHRKTGDQYIWQSGTGDIIHAVPFDFDVLDDISFFERLPEIKTGDGPITEGRNNKLRDIVSSMRSRGESEDSIVREIYEYDLKNHLPPLFSDPKEKYRAKTEDDAIRAAFMFVTSVTKSLLEAKIKIPVRILNSVIDNNGQQQTTIDNKFEYRPLPPMPSGFISSFVLAANKYSKVDVVPLALGGAVSCLLGLLSGRFVFKADGDPMTTWPNEYVLGLGGSGVGKSRIAYLIHEILEGSDVLGGEMYKSGESFIKELPNKPVRLNLIDEAASFFESMGSGSGDFKSTLADYVNKIYNSSNRFFSGVSSIKGGQHMGACWNPCVSLFCLTHQDGFNNSSSSYFSRSGLLPRFLIFEVKEIKRNNFTKEEKKEAEVHMEYLKDFVREFLCKFQLQTESEYTIEHEVDLNNPLAAIKKSAIKYAPRVFQLTKDAQEFYDQYAEHNFERMIAASKDEEAFYQRLLEHGIKLSMAYAASNMNTTITREALVWGTQLAETLFHNASIIRSDMLVVNPLANKIDKVRAALRSGPMTRSELSRKLKIYGGQLSQMMTQMREDGEVSQIILQTDGRSKTVYRLESSVQ